MSRFLAKFFLIVGAVVLAVILGILSASIAGCKHRHDTTVIVEYPPVPNPVITCVVENGKVIISAHTLNVAKIYRSDDQTNHIATFERSITLEDFPCAGDYEYVVENLETGESDSCAVVLPEVSSVVVGCKPDEEKVQICHNGHNILVPKKAVEAHLKHGDYLGGCLQEICNNGIDDDLDGKMDCDDSECENSPDCAVDPPVTPEDCTNGVDDDLDGLVDCLDPECQGNPACKVDPPTEECGGAWRILVFTHNHRWQ